MTKKQPRTFRASLLWRGNIIGALLLGSFAGATFVGLAVWVLLFGRALAPVSLVILGLGLNGLLWPLLWWAGKLAATFPIAVQVGDSLVVYGPFLRVCIEWDEVDRVYDSCLRQGFVIALVRRRGLLKHFVIHWLFGPDRQRLIAAVEEAVAKRAARRV
jgi:hypothetical protein